MKKMNEEKENYYRQNLSGNEYSQNLSPAGMSQANPFYQGYNQNTMMPNQQTYN